MELVRSDVRRRDQKAPRPTAFIFELARAPGRGVSTDYRRDALPVACGRSRRRVARIFCHETTGSQGCAVVSRTCDEAPWPAADRLRSYGDAMKMIANLERQECGRWLNNWAGNSHQPFRRGEEAMAQFRDIKTLQKLAPAHASIFNRFDNDRHPNPREACKQNRSVALAEWRQLAA